MDPLSGGWVNSINKKKKNQKNKKKGQKIMLKKKRY